MKNKQKKMALAALALMCATIVKAQQEVGTFSLIPRIGVNLSNISSNDVATDLTTSASIDSKHKAGMKVGVDAEYQATRSLAVSAGVFYSMQGCRFSDFSCLNSIDQATKVQSYSGFNDFKEDRQYVTVPLMLHYYVAPNLAINVGGQLGFLVKSKTSFSMQDYTVDADGKVEWDSDSRKDVNNDMKDVTAKFDFSTPIGLSYEYENVILDARYVHGWTKTNTGSLSELSAQRNRTFEFTVAYRFAL